MKASIDRIISAGSPCVASVRLVPENEADQSLLSKLSDHELLASIGYRGSINFIEFANVQLQGPKTK